MSLQPILKSGSQKNENVTRHCNNRHVVFDDTYYSDSFVIDMPESETDLTLSETSFTAYVKMFFKRAEKAFSKLDLKRSILDKISVISSGLNDIPSTPIYSDTTIESREKYLGNSPTQGNLVWTVFMLSITFFLQACSRDFFIPFFEPTLIGFPDWSRVFFGLATLWNPVVGLLLSVPSAQFIIKYGIKTTLLFSCVLSTLGAGVRLCLPLLDDATSMIHLSTVFLTCASVVSRPLTATVCAYCFRDGERNLVSATLISSSMMGTAFGYLIRMKFDSSPFLLEPTLLVSYCKTVVMILMYTIFILSVLWTLFVYAYFPQESLIICRGYQSTMRQKKTCVPSIKFLWRTMLRSKSLLCVALAYSLSNSWTWVWYQTIEVTLFEVGFPEKVGRDYRFWLLVHTCMLALSIGWFADQLVEHKKRLCQVIQFFATACLLWVVCMLHVRSYRQNTVQLLIGIMFGFPLCWSTTGVMHEMAWQYAYPMQENMAVGVLEVFKYAGEICAYAFMMLFPIFHLYWLHIIAVVAGTFSFVFILCAKRLKTDI